VGAEKSAGIEGKYLCFFYFFHFPFRRPQNTFKLLTDRKKEVRFSKGIVARSPFLGG